MAVVAALQSNVCLRKSHNSLVQGQPGRLELMEVIVWMEAAWERREERDCLESIKNNLHPVSSGWDSDWLGYRVQWTHQQVEPVCRLLTTLTNGCAGTV